MNDDTRNSKSCDPQPLAAETPTSQWELDKLTAYVQKQYHWILQQEKRATGSYWRLGQALSLARKQFAHGQWEKYLEKCGVDKTRACKAQTIYDRFPIEEEAARLTVDEAYREGRQRKADQGTEKVGGASTTCKAILLLRRSIGKIAERVDFVIDDAGFAPAEEAVVLIPAIRQTIQRLQQLLTYLEQQEALDGADETTNQ